jgi:hypothetical protein
MRIIIASFFVCFQSFGQSNYWQQEVDYQINVTIDNTKDKAFGEETLIYQNNSPDTLKELYFHLYWNAFKKYKLPQNQAHQDLQNDAPFLVL